MTVRQRAPYQLLTWALRDPPDGVDGGRWSRVGFLERAIPGWALEDPAVRATTERLLAEGCRLLSFSVIKREDRLRVYLSWSPPARPKGVYKRPYLNVRVIDPMVERQLRFLVDLQALNLPDSPVMDEFRRRRVNGDGEEAFPPFRAREELRELDRGPERIAYKEVAKRDGTPYRVPHSSGRQFTDLWPADLLRVFDEAERLVELFWESGRQGCWPLLPQEHSRLRRPPAAHRHPRDYEEMLAEDPAFVRPPHDLAGDLVLLRLGYDPDDKQRRDALKQQRRRALKVV